MTIALARRYRPKRFADLLVQDHVAAVLRGAVEHHRVGHGYLLTGPRGVGKTTAARILAMALNCEAPDAAPAPGEPCGQCPSCERIWAGGASLDVVEIDAASNRGVDDARDLRERAMYAASKEGHYKVYIVDEAHMLTREAWNALLKILEEPPPKVVFVFATTEPQKIANTAAPVMSRLQRFGFRRIGPAAIRARLRAVVDAEDLEAEEDALRLIARRADGGMRDALSVLDQCLSLGDGPVTAERVREVLGTVDEERYRELLDMVLERRPADVFPLVDQLIDAGADLTEFLGGAADMLRALLMIKVGAVPDDLSESMQQMLSEAAPTVEAGDLLRMLALFSEIETGVRRSGSPRLLVETLLLRWAMMDRIVDLRQVLDAPKGGAPPPARASRPSDAVPSPAPAPAPAPAPNPSPRVPEGSETGPDAQAGADPHAGVPMTLDGLAGSWEAFVAEARSVSPFLGEAMAAARPVEVDGARVTLAMVDANPIFAETLERQHRRVEAVLGRHTGRQPTVEVTAAPASGTGDPPSRLRSEAELRADRLRVTRKADPALDAAAEALDLEIVE